MSGGVFQNALLTTEVVAQLEREGFASIVIAGFRPAMAGLSLGQLAVAAAGITSADSRQHLDSTRSPLFYREPLMCLAIPGKVVETYREHDVRMGKVDFGGILKRVCLEHVPDAGIDDYVLVHVGFALSRIDEAEAMRVFEFLSTMDQLDELDGRFRTRGGRGTV